MPPAKHIVSLLLVLLLSTSGLPLFYPEDASRDGRVDLRDAVLLVRDLSVEADRPGLFGREFTNLVKAVRVVAGLVTDIRQQTDTAPGPDTTILKERHDQSLLPRIPALVYLGGEPCPAFETLSTYQSVVLTPTTPPPKNGLA